MKLSLAIMGSFLLALPVSASETNQVAEFLRAADNGENAKMISLMSDSQGVSGKKLLRKIENCYLRRVYGTPDKGIVAAWMCPEGEKKSRVIMADIGLASDGVAVQIAMERRNNRPAPARTGSALAEGDQ